MSSMSNKNVVESEESAVSFACSLLQQFFKNGLRDLGTAHTSSFLARVFPSQSLQGTLES